jgi:hypothetical protein
VEGIGGVFIQVEVQVVAGVGINGDNSDVVLVVDLAVESITSHVGVCIIIQPALPDFRQFRGQPPGGVVNVVHDIDREAFVVSLDGVDCLVGPGLLKNLGDLKGVVELGGGGLGKDVVSGVVSGPENHIDIEVGSDEVGKLFNGSLGNQYESYEICTKGISHFSTRLPQC